MTEPTIDAPGVYDIDEATYNRDPVRDGSLSRTGARKLLDCPARYQWWRTHGDPPKAEFDLGKATHRLLLGTGAPLRIVDYGDWRTRQAQTDRAEARAAGEVPILAADHQAAQAAVAALRTHPVTSALFDPDHGQPERTLVWREWPIGVWCRARLDWLPEPRGGRLLVADFKTCTSANPKHIERAIDNYGYHLQAAFYLAGLKALNLADEDARFLLVFQERTAPYLITVAEVGQTALKIGDHLMGRALGLYAECTTTGRWPGYAGDEVVYAGLPAYAERTYLEEMSE